MTRRRTAPLLLPSTPSMFEIVPSLGLLVGILWIAVAVATRNAGSSAHVRHRAAISRVGRAADVPCPGMSRLVRRNLSPREPARASIPDRQAFRPRYGGAATDVSRSQVL